MNSYEIPTEAPVSAQNLDVRAAFITRTYNIVIITAHELNPPAWVDSNCQLRRGRPPWGRGSVNGVENTKQIDKMK